MLVRSTLTLIVTAAALGCGVHHDSPTIASASIAASRSEAATRRDVDVPPEPAMCVAPDLECGVGSAAKDCAGTSESCTTTECCDGLECCAGVPVPPGKEFCAEQCPISDRAQKREFAEVDVQAVLATLAAVPITTWSYKHENPQVRHIGPMAQDFQAAFGVGASDKYIFQIDADGVALASIQALHRRLEDLEQENAALRARLDGMERRRR